MAELERKVGQLTMEIDLLKGGAVGTPAQRRELLHRDVPTVSNCGACLAILREDGCRALRTFATSPDHLTDNTGAKF